MCDKEQASDFAIQLICNFFPIRYCLFG